MHFVVISGIVEVLVILVIIGAIGWVGAWTILDWIRGRW